MDNKVFNRIEKKYLINSDEKAQFLKAIKKHMNQDGYHKSKVFNLYFDTENYDLIIQSIDQPIFKHKLRARSYGGYDRVFLEIKTKMRGHDLNPGFKRRVMISKKDFKELTSGKTSMEELAKRSIETNDDIQIAREVDYLIQLFDLRPRLLVMYDRESYKGDDNLRITFDEKLRSRDKDLRFCRSKYDKMYFKDDRDIIMEVKAHGTLPFWLVDLMSKQKVFPQQFSKVGKIYAKMLSEGKIKTTKGK